MKKERNFFSGIKSMCFMLFACLILSICATSCSSDEFETNLPEEQKQYTKAELIEQALSRMPQTRGENPNAVVMVTIKKLVSIRCMALNSIEIQWGDGNKKSIPPFSNIEHTYTYTDSNLSHYITLSGAKNAILNLTVDNNELIFLNVSYNENLRTISCLNNRLDELISTGCSALQSLYIANNELSSLEVGHLSKLQTLQADHNLLTEIDVSKNSDLMVLWLGNNRLKDFDISKNLNMAILEIENNPIESIDLSEHMNLTELNVSYTQITELDLSKSVNLQSIILEGLSIETFNNNLISDTSFAIYSQLWQLNVAYTPFTGLDLSNNPKINHIDISGTLITQLDISVLQIRCLRATRSKLTGLIWGENSLKNLYELRIERTPFEDASKNTLNLLKDLPPRSEGDPGHLYTYAFFDLSELYEINWLVNQ